MCCGAFLTCDQLCVSEGSWGKHRAVFLLVVCVLISQQSVWLEYGSPCHLQRFETLTARQPHFCCTSSFLSLLPLNDFPALCLLIFSLVCLGCLESVGKLNVSLLFYQRFDLMVCSCRGTECWELAVLALLVYLTGIQEALAVLVVLVYRDTGSFSGVSSAVQGYRKL